MGIMVVLRVLRREATADAMAAIVEATVTEMPLRLKGLLPALQIASIRRRTPARVRLSAATAVGAGIVAAAVAVTAAATATASLAPTLLRRWRRRMRFELNSTGKTGKTLTGRFLSRRLRGPHRMKMPKGRTWAKAHREQTELVAGVDVAGAAVVADRGSVTRRRR
jgi:hypothetical protein